MNHLMDLVFGGDAWGIAFWGAPGGIFILVTIMACSVGNIWCHFIDDTLVDRIYYGLWALMCLSVLIHVHNNTAPYNIIKMMMFSIAIRFLIAFVCRRINYRKTGQRQSTNSHGH